MTILKIIGLLFLSGVKLFLCGVIIAWGTFKLLLGADYNGIHRGRFKAYYKSIGDDFRKACQ